MKKTILMPVKLTSYITLVESVYWVAFRAYPTNPEIQILSGHNIFGEHPRSYLTKKEWGHHATDKNISDMSKTRLEFTCLVRKIDSDLYNDYLRTFVENNTQKANILELKLLDAEDALFNTIKLGRIKVYGLPIRKIKSAINFSTIPEFNIRKESREEYLEKYCDKYMETSQLVEQLSKSLDNWKDNWMELPKNRIVQSHQFSWDKSKWEGIEAYSHLLLDTNALMAVFPPENLVSRAKAPINTEPKFIDSKPVFKHPLAVFNKQRKHELHQFIAECYEKLFEEKKRKPTAVEIWNSLKKTAVDSESVIQEIKGKTIYWRSSHGNDQIMRFSTFQNVVSLIRKDFHV